MLLSVLTVVLLGAQVQSCVNRNLLSLGCDWFTRKPSPLPSRTAADGFSMRRAYRHCSANQPGAALDMQIIRAPEGFTAERHCSPSMMWAGFVLHVIAAVIATALLGSTGNTAHFATTLPLNRK